MFIIYEIKNKITGKRYIGSSKDYKVRWKRHLNELLKDKHHCSYLQRSFNKHGSEAFSFSNGPHCLATRSLMLFDEVAAVLVIHYV